MAELAYSVILEPEADGSAWNVSVPALPEINTFGETQAAALEMARDAIELSLAYRRDEGMEIPPSDANRTRLVTVTVPAA